MGLFSSKSRPEQARGQAKKHWDRLDVDVDDLQKKVRELQSRVREVRLSRQQEPESSSAGFIAGVAVGVMLGVVLSYLFGQKGGGEMVDQFAHRAEGLKGTATGRYYQARGRAEGQADTAGEGPAIKREFDDASDGFAETADGTINDANDTLEDLKKRSETT